MNKEKKYEEVDIESLSTALAERDWEESVKDQPEAELYEIIQKESGVWPYTDEPEIREVKPYWASIFFGLRSSYLKLINTYKKNPDSEL